MESQRSIETSCDAMKYGLRDVGSLLAQDRSCGVQSMHSLIMINLNTFNNWFVNNIKPIHLYTNASLGN